MASPNSSIDLNKRAVLLLRCGDCRGALQALDKALSCLEASRDSASATLERTSLRCTFGGSTNITQQRMQIDDNEHDEECQLRSVPICSRYPNASLHMPVGPVEPLGNLFDFYPRMMVMERRGPELEHVAILYNMAVANHTEGIRRGWLLQMWFFERALDLYNMAQAVLYETWHDIADDEALLLLSLALANNVGHVHYHLCNFRDSQSSLEALQHFMDSLPEECEGEDEIVPGNLCREDYEFFNKTSVIFQGANFMSAPSA